VRIAVEIGRDFELLDHGGCYHWQGKRARQLRKFERLLNREDHMSLIVR